MKEKIVEILIYIMSEIQESKGLHDIDLHELKRKGYTQLEISAAFSWLYDNIPVQEGMVVASAKPSQASRRYLHDVEKLMLSTESQGFLMQLTELGLLDSRDLEEVIERVMLAGFEKLSVTELHQIVASVLFARSDNHSQGSRVMHNRKDTIH